MGKSIFHQKLADYDTCIKLYQFFLASNSKVRLFSFTGLSTAILIACLSANTSYQLANHYQRHIINIRSKLLGKFEQEICQLKGHQR